MKRKSIVSPFFTASFCFLLFSVLALIISLKSISVASFLNEYVSGALRAALSFVTSAFPFSLFEVLIILSPVIFIFLLVCVFKEKETRAVLYKSLDTFAAFFLIFSMYVWTVGIAYSSLPIYQSYVETDSDLTETDFISVAKFIANKSVESYTEFYGNYSREIIEEYERFFADSRKFVGVFVRVKPLLFSSLASTIGTLALYSFPTGEINVNTEIPECMIPFTVAHEYAHFIGAAGEADADFIAFAVLINSSKDPLSYSAYITMLIEFLSVIPDSEALKIYSDLPREIAFDLQEYYDFSEKYSGRIKNSADELNSSHSGLFDENGENNYSFALKLIVSYLQNNN